VKRPYIDLGLALVSEANAQEIPIAQRSVPRGVESRVAAASMWQIKGGNGRCQSRGTPALEIISAPSHGTVRCVQGDVGIPEGSGCSNSIYGVVVLYQPAPGFVGTDQFTYNRVRDAMVMNWVGSVPPGPRKIVVTVQ
jgi:hypothetical protein